MGSKIEVEGSLGEMFRVQVDRIGFGIEILPVVFRMVEGLEDSNEIQECSDYVTRTSSHVNRHMGWGKRAMETNTCFDL
jgi:hypothetical protein